MKKKDPSGSITRRQVLQASAASALLLSFPGLAGCTSLPRYHRVGAAEGQALVLVNGNLVDVVSGGIGRGKAIVVRRGIIESITDRPPVLPEGSLLLDLKNQYLIPGLIDAHCHTTLTSESQLSLSGMMTTYSQFNRNFTQQLAHGVTTVRDMGAMPKLLHDAVKRVKNNEMIGPRVVYCNAFTNLYRSHPDIDPEDISIFSGLMMAFAGNPSLWFKNTRELEERMKENSAGGASFIKLTMDRQSVMCGLKEIPVYTDEHLRVIMAFAKEHNLPVAAHIHTRFGFERALQYGIDSMEHSIGDAQLTDGDVQLMARKKIAVMPTMIVAQMMAAEEAYDALPPHYRTDFIVNELAVRREYLNADRQDDVLPAIHQANMDSLKNFQKYGCKNLYRKGKLHARPDLYFDILLNGPGNLLKMKQAGVLIGCGTDAGVPFVYHGSLWREMEMLGRIGFTNKEILQCATINNARILRLADKIGTIEKGKYADMVVLQDNPQEKIETCRTPKLVIKEGRVYDVNQKV